MSMLAYFQLIGHKSTYYVAVDSTPSTYLAKCTRVSPGSKYVRFGAGSSGVRLSAGSCGKLVL